MPLTNAQLQTLKADIAADPVFSTLPASTANAIQIAAGYNAAASPAEKAWVSVAERRVLDGEADYSAFDAIAAGKRDAWRIFIDGAPRDMTRNKARKLVSDVWGNSNSSSTVAFAVYTGCTRSVSRGEKLLGGADTASEGSGSGTVTAKKLSWEGLISPGDVEAAWSI